MARSRKKPTNVAEVEPGSVDELTRIIALALRYQGVPEGALVHDLTDLGVPVGRIALLLNTSGNNVSQKKRRARPEWPKKEKSPGG